MVTTSGEADPTPVETFSGTHPFRFDHLRDAVHLAHIEAGDEGLDDEDVQEVVEKLGRLIRDGRCPRCGGTYVQGEIPSGSRLTLCRCVPVCMGCGSREATSQLYEWWLQPYLWPLDHNEEDAIRTDLGIPTQAEHESSRTPGFLDSSGALLTEEGVGVVDFTPTTGGWAEFGHDEDDSEKTT
jgi:hypothetical protein